MKRFLVVICILIFLISSTSCSKKEEEQQNISDTATTTTVNSEIIKEEYNNFSQIVSDNDNEVNDVSSWTVTDIISCYKSAAAISTSNITSVQNIALNNIVINDGTGMANSIIKMVQPIISKIVSGNSTEFSGITGGYTDLCEDDIKKASAVANGENIIVRLEMNEQTDIGEMNENGGSVGHAIFVIGDLSTVMGQLSEKGLPLEIESKNVSTYYKNAVVNVTIDKNGNILNGTWSYTVTISMKDFKVAGSTVDKTEVTIDNVITYNGGFPG